MNKMFLPLALLLSISSLIASNGELAAPTPTDTATTQEIVAPEPITIDAQDMATQEPTSEELLAPETTQSAEEMAAIETQEPTVVTTDLATETAPAANKETPKATSNEEATTLEELPMPQESIS